MLSLPLLPPRAVSSFTHPTRSYATLGNPRHSYASLRKPNLNHRGRLLPKYSILKCRFRPLIHAQDASLWPSHNPASHYFDPSASSDAQNPNNNGNAQNSQSTSQRQSSQHRSHSSFLVALAADENTTYQRKQNIRRFGAGWIRPPGVVKTFQTQMDEEAERVEQEALARREQALLDLQAAQTEAANREATRQADETVLEGEGERDLDDDVPEAAASDDSSVSGSVSSSEVSDSELVEDEEEEQVDASVLEHTQADMTFNEESFLEGGSLLAPNHSPSPSHDGTFNQAQEEEEVAHMLEMEEAEMSGILQEERDLDDDIPEAGEYEHTDTELSLSSDEEGSSRLSASILSNRRLSSAPGTAPRRSTRRSSGFQSMRSTGRSVRTTRSSLGQSAQTHPRSSLGTQHHSSTLTPQERTQEEPQEQRPQRVPPPRLFDPRQSFNFDANASFGFDGSSSLLDGSSFLHSSPAATRGGNGNRSGGSNLRTRFAGGRAPPRG